LGYDFLVDITASDESKESQGYHVIYSLLSLKDKCRIVVKFVAEKSAPSVSDLWSGALWAEREIFDMFGLSFDNEASNKRIIMDYAFSGHPLRKECKLL